MRYEAVSGQLRLALIRHVAELNEDQALALAQRRIAQNDDPLSIVEDAQEGLRQVGERYERREYFLSGLIMGGEIFTEIMQILAPMIETRFVGHENGAILLGTVQGDIHDIGKNNLALLLTGYGFTVHDLGVDVAPELFLSKALDLRPDLIGLSGLLTSSYDSMRDTVSLIRSSDDQAIAMRPIVLGGNQLTQQVCEYVGADAWVTDAMTGVRVCQQLLKVGC